MNKSCKVNSGGWGALRWGAFLVYLSLRATIFFPSRHPIIIKTSERYDIARCAHKRQISLESRHWEAGIPPYLNYSRRLQCMCGCKSWSTKRYAINVKVTADDAGWRNQPRHCSLCLATELALFLVSILWKQGMEMKSFRRDLPSRWQSAACWEAIFRH